MSTDYFPLKAVVVGGGMGGRLSMDALARSSRYQLVAAADLRPEVRASLEQLYPALQTFASHREMFQTIQPDVVCVSTFPPSHEEVTDDALQIPRLRGLLVEKPLGHTAAAGERILKAIEKRQLPVVTPHNLVAHRTGLEILERVKQGEIGRLHLFEVQSNHWDIINAGIHWMQFFEMLTPNDPVKSVLCACDATTRTFRDGMQVETVAVTSVVKQSGVRAVMHTGDELSVNHPDTECVFRIFGTAGFIEFYGYSNRYRLLNAAHSGGADFQPEDLEVTGHQFHLENLAAQIESQKMDRSISNSSLAALEICEAAYLSARHGCEVRFPFKTFVPPQPVEWEVGQPYGGHGGGRDGRQLA